MRRQRSASISLLRRHDGQSKTLYQEGAGTPPIPIRGAHGESLQLGDFFDAKSAEYVPLDNLSRARVERGEFDQALIQSQHVGHVARGVAVVLIEFGENYLASALQAHAVARVIDQHLPHCASRERKEMRPVPAMHVGMRREFEIDLV